MYPVMLPGTPRDDQSVSTFRNPDGHFPQQVGTPPDRIGVLFVRILELLADGWNAVHRPRRRQEAQQSACADMPDGCLSSVR